MFEFLFKYPASLFARGSVVLLGSWPIWILWTGIVALAGLLAAVLWRRRKHFVPGLRGGRPIILWVLQSALLTLLLLLLWQPAISVTALKPQQNIIAVVVDDSRSMAVKDVGDLRQHQAIDLLNSGLLPDLQKRYQVRLYRMSAGI